MRGMGGSDSEPVVIEMTDDVADLLVRAINLALVPQPGVFTAPERSVLTATQAALREMTV